MMRDEASLWGRVALDAVLINVAFVLAYIIRYQLEFPYPVDPLYDAPFTPYIPFAVGVTLLCLFMFSVDGLYMPGRRRRMTGEVYRIINGTTTTIIAIMAITFFIQPLVYSRGMMLAAAALIVVFLSAERVIENAVIAARRRHGIGMSRVLVLGGGEVGRAVMRTILASPGLGYRIVGYLDDDPTTQNGLGRIHNLGGLDRLQTVLKEEAVDEVIVALPWKRHRQIMQIVDDCTRWGMRARVVPDMFQRRMQNVDYETLSGIPLFSPGLNRLPAGAIVLKRGSDLLISIIALPFFLLIYAVVGLLIKIDSPGPVIYRQCRVGRNGETFDLLKFRTMVKDADKLKEQVVHLSKYQGDTLLKIPDDPRMTRVGRLLRRLSIDELPQLLNVLRGEMSLVGPRPNIPEEVAKYEPWQRQRLNVVPGMTGLWQVSGRSDVPFDEMCLLDIFYIENWSLGLDIRIMIQTIPGVLFGNGAY
jgi:exopolysaccharide biosynthesis polyprenyl glycosylphosphotransferase